VNIFDCELFAVAALDVANNANRAGKFSGREPRADMPPLLEYANINPDWVDW
jgi:hypothetical protein